MKKDSFFIKAAFLLAAIIFFAGLFVPLGVAEAVPYVFVVLMTLWISDKKFIYVAGTFTTILTLTGIYFDPGKVVDWNVVIANSSISIIGIWLSVYVVYRQKKIEEVAIKSKEQLEVMNVTLETLVSQRTNALTILNKDLEQSKVELQNALGKEIALNEMKSRFVTMASHEFRTPLSSILSSASLIGQYSQVGETVKMQKHLMRIKSSVNDLTIILDDFLSLEKLESGNVEVIRKSIALPEFCTEIVEDIHSIMKMGQRVKYQHSGPTEIIEDKKILQHILLNLLSNACKYSDEDTEIILSTVVTGTKISISVKDNGMGIPEEEQLHVFSRFFRAQNAVNIKGTGLGLNIVKRYVELISGKIFFESISNEGSTFFVEFPTHTVSN